MINVHIHKAVLKEYFHVIVSKNINIMVLSVEELKKPLKIHFLIYCALCIMIYAHMQKHSPPSLITDINTLIKTQEAVKTCCVYQQAVTHY